MLQKSIEKHGDLDVYRGDTEGETEIDEIRLETAANLFEDVDGIVLW